MITFEEAFAKAKVLKKNIVRCIEYDTAYVFAGKDDDKSIGGYDKEPVVILKEDGSIIDITAFFDSDAVEELRQLSLGAERWSTKQSH